MEKSFSENFSKQFCILSEIWKRVKYVCKTNQSASDHGSMQVPSSSSELVSTFVLQHKLLWYVHDEK